MTHSQPFLAPPVASTQPALAGAELGMMLLGPSNAMGQLWSQIRRLAPHVRSLLLTGDPDCGQEAVARLLLDFSLHPRRTFVQLTAADAEARLTRSSGLSSLPSELFLYLPDVHRLSLAAQDGLLRLMRMRRSRPFTVVAATAEDLRVLVANGRFTAALAEALASLRIVLPALRERPEDLPMLINHLLTSSCQKADTPTPHATESFLQAAMEYTWPGNLRELAQTLTRLATNAASQELEAADLTRAAVTYQPESKDTAASVRLIPLDTVLHEHINAVLQACRGNKLRASEILGISRSTLYRMLDTANVVKAATLSMAS